MKERSKMKDVKKMMDEAKAVQEALESEVKVEEARGRGPCFIYRVKS